MTYICRSKISLHIYAKHQYRQESELEIRGALYILTYEYNYKVITRCDTILLEYNITDRRKCENTKRYTIINCTKGRSRVTEGKLETRAGGLEG